MKSFTIPQKIIALLLAIAVLVLAVFLFYKLQPKTSFSIQKATSPTSSSSLTPATLPTLPPDVPYQLKLNTTLDVRDEKGQTIEGCEAVVGLRQETQELLQKNYQSKMHLVGDHVKSIFHSVASLEREKDPLILADHVFTFENIPPSFTEKNFLLEPLSVRLPNGYREATVEEKAKNSDFDWRTTSTSITYKDSRQFRTADIVFSLQVIKKK